MADIVLYGSSQEEQGFPPLYPSHDLRNPFHHTWFSYHEKICRSILIIFFLFYNSWFVCEREGEIEREREGTFYFVLHFKLLLYHRWSMEPMVFFSQNITLVLYCGLSRFWFRIEDFRFAQTVVSSGRQLAKNIMACKCITGYASLLENLLNFPLDVLLPALVSEAGIVGMVPFHEGNRTRKRWYFWRF